jgi:hypothetical protein
MSSDRPRESEPFLYLASHCYGGLARAGHMRSVLALRAACAVHNVALQLDLGGGEALLSRGRAAMSARFLASAATHVLLVDGDIAFDPTDVLAGLDTSESVVKFSGSMLLVRRDAMRRVVETHPDLAAGLGDIRGPGGTRAIMIFETILDPKTGAYIADLEAFLHRWRARPGTIE